jgi:hypothetical protein
MEGRLDMETSNRPCGRITRSLAFAATGKGEARMRRSKGPKPLRRTPLSDSPARRETPTVLNPSNRRIRTRTYGGVGGEESRDSPYPDRNDGSTTDCLWLFEILKLLPCMRSAPFPAPQNPPDRGREGFLASPPSEPYVRFSRIRLSGCWFPHRGCLSCARAV